MMCVFVTRADREAVYRVLRARPDLLDQITAARGALGADPPPIALSGEFRNNGSPLTARVLVPEGTGALQISAILRRLCQEPVRGVFWSFKLLEPAAMPAEGEEPGVRRYERS